MFIQYILVHSYFRWIFLLVYAIFCYSFILTSIFYDSQFLFVEAIIHLRKTIFHISNLRNKNDSSHPKYVSEMKKKFSLSIFCALFIFHWKFTAYVCTEYIPPQIEKEKGPSIQGFFLSSTIYASLVTSWLCWR